MVARTTSTIRVAIVQDDALERDLLRVGLGHGIGIDVVGAFGDGRSLLQAAPSLAPHVAVLDLDPRANNGVPLATKLRRILPDVGIVLLAGERAGELLASLPGHGVDRWTYLVPRAHAGLTTLLRAIQVTHARLLDLSGVDLTPPNGQVSSMPKHTPLDAPDRSEVLARLSARQREVLGLLALGLTNRSIAMALGLKEKTVENQVASIYQRLEPDADRSGLHPRVWAALQFARARRDQSAADE